MTIPGSGKIQETIGRFAALPLVEGTRWTCIRCGRCCTTSFAVDWLDWLGPEGLTVVDDRCPLLTADNACSQYGHRFPACRAFPFSLKKGDDGLYHPVVFADCPGVGKGDPVDVRKRIGTCVRMAERKLGISYVIHWDGFEETGAVGLEMVPSRIRD